MSDILTNMDSGGETWWEKQVGCRGPFRGTGRELPAAPVAMDRKSIIDR